MVNVTVHAPMSLKRYPYDRHIVPFCLATRATKDANGKWKNKWELSKEWPEWAPDDYDEDKTMLSESQTTPDLEYRHKQCFVYLEAMKPIFCVLLQRNPTRVIQRTTVPVFIVVCIALAVSGIKGGSFQDEYGAVLTSLLTMTAFSYSVQSSLPTQPMPYLAWAEYYFVVRLSLHTLILIPSAPLSLVSPRVAVWLHLIMLIPSAPSVLSQPRDAAVWLHLPFRNCHQGNHRISSVR